MWFVAKHPEDRWRGWFVILCKNGDEVERYGHDIFKTVGLAQLQANIANRN